MNTHQEQTHDQGAVDAIISAPEFAALCTQVMPFVEDGLRPKEMRTAICLFATVAKGHGWLPEDLIRALQESECYPIPGVSPLSQPKSRRYRQALSFLLYDYFKDE